MAWKKTQPIYMYPAHKYSKVVSLISRIDDDSFRLKGLHLNMYNHLYRSHRAAAIPMQSWSVLVHICYVYAGMFIHFSRQSNEEEKKTFRCQIWTKVIWIVSGYLVFFFLSNFFLSSFVSFECDVECMSKARSLIEDPIEVNRERPFAFGKLWENIEVWDTEQQSQWTVYDAWTFYTCLHVAFIQCRSLLCLILLQKCSECLHKLLASLCSTSLCWLSRCLAYDYLCFG